MQLERVVEPLKFSYVHSIAERFAGFDWIIRTYKPPLWFNFFRNIGATLITES
jgi:hypothetical protein